MYGWEQDQVLSRQQISLVLLTHKRNNVTETGTNPLFVSIKPCQDLDHHYLVT